MSNIYIIMANVRCFCPCGTGDIQKNMRELSKHMMERKVADNFKLDYPSYGYKKSGGVLVGGKKKKLKKGGMTIKPMYKKSSLYGGALPKNVLKMSLEYPSYTIPEIYNLAKHLK